MPSKGVHCYGYVAVPDCRITFSVPGETAEAANINEFFTHVLEVDKDKLGGVFKLTGRFSFIVHRGEQQLTEQWAEVNAVTGKMTAGTMKDMSQSLSIVQPDLIITYGFYDAGQSGEGGLTKMDQVRSTDH